MSGFSEHLPSFGKPPLTEVVVSLQFEPLDKFSVAHLGLFWQRVRNRFPTVAHAQPVDRIVERLGVSPAKSLALKLANLSGPPPVPRLWCIDHNEQEMIQIQADRFSLNWRKVSDTDSYPRYKSYIRDKFSLELKELVHFLADEKIGEIKPKQCELTYINHIAMGSGWNKHSELGRVFVGWNDKIIEDFSAEIEDIGINMRVILRDKRKEFIGRLHINISPALRNKDKMPIIVLNLTARGIPFRDDFNGVFDFYDFAHEQIVKNFDAITTTKMHQIWEKG